MNHLPQFEDYNVIVGYNEGKPIVHTITAEQQRNAYFEYGMTLEDLKELSVKFYIL